MLEFLLLNMLEIFQNFITTLQSNAPLGVLVASKNITSGPVDITMEKQKELRYPSIVLSQVSEVSRSVPPVRDTQVQLDIWSRNSQFELENIYEAVVKALNYQSGNQSTAHIFWQRLAGAVDMYESERRLWHRACTFVVWSIKP